MNSSKNKLKISAHPKWTLSLSQSLRLLFMNSSRNNEVCLSNACPKKKKMQNADALGFSAESKRNLSKAWLNDNICRTPNPS